MGMQVLISCFVVGAVLEWLLWRIVQSPRTWERAVQSLVGAACLLLIGAMVLPNFVSPVSTGHYPHCTINLRLMQGAKEAWASDSKKAEMEIPYAADIFGTDAYIRVEPICPDGGAYKLGAVREKPTCSIGGALHSYERPMPEKPWHAYRNLMAWGFCSGVGAVLSVAMVRQSVGKQKLIQAGTLPLPVK